MPCSDGGESAYYAEKERKDHRDVLGEKDENIRLLSASLCAIFNELNIRGLTDEVIKDAEVNGMVNITGFLMKHEAHDRQKMKAVIQGLSIHEEELLKRILNEDR